MIEIFRNRKGQTAVEYILTTVSLFLSFTMMYRGIQWYVSKQFQDGAKMIATAYIEDPW